MGIMLSSNRNTRIAGRYVAGRYRLDQLIEQYGIDAKLFDWEPEFDCPRKLARHEMTHAALGCRDCSKFSSRDHRTTQSVVP